MRRRERRRQYDPGLAVQGRDGGPHCGADHQAVIDQNDGAAADASGRRRRTPPHETILRFGLGPALGRLQPPVEGREAAAAENLERKGDGAEGADQQERPPDGLTPVFGKAIRQEEAETRTKGLRVPAIRASSPAESLVFLS